MTAPAGQSCATCISYNNGLCSYETPAYGWPPVESTKWCAHYNLLPDAISGLVSIIPSYTVATLPAVPERGMLVVVTDASSNSWGNPPGAGGGIQKVLAWYPVGLLSENEDEPWQLYRFK